tara:strand:- start:15578 stop:16579 length:1002 start_codon:yes stop_codon:yes gene_type:complete
MIIVFDTNVWISELGLQSPSGAAVRFFVRSSGARVALPEVVRLEVERNLSRQLRKYVDDIQNQHRQLLTVFGRLKAVVLPTEEDIRNRIEEIFSGFDGALIDIPLSLESARNALLKVVDKVPPCDKSQEYKDSVLWEHCLTLLRDDHVILVTADKAFYESRIYGNGLVANLVEESCGTPYCFKVVPNLTDLLSDLRTDVDIDERQLTAAIYEKYGQAIDDMLTRNGFYLGSIQDVSRDLYVTENPDRLFLEFRVLWECPDATGQNRDPAILTVPGDGMYIGSEGNFNDLRSFGEELSFTLEDGTEREARSARAYAGNAVIGHRDTMHTVRLKV